MAKKSLAEADKMDQAVIRSKHKTLDEYWKSRGNHNLGAIPKGGPCVWCKRFRPLAFRVCMNCGAQLGGEGFFEAPEGSP